MDSSKSCGSGGTSRARTSASRADGTGTTPNDSPPRVIPIRSEVGSRRAWRGRGETSRELSTLTRELVGKQLQMLKEVVPEISRVTVLSNPTVPSNALLLQTAADAPRHLSQRLQM